MTFNIYKVKIKEKMLKGDEMNKIKELFGLEIKLSRWPGEEELPLYLREQYRFEAAMIGDAECLLLTPTSELGTLPAIKKQIRVIEQMAKRHVVFDLVQISEYRQDSLIKASIPFLLGDKMIYLPFMATYLSKMKKPRQYEKLQPSAQVVLLKMLYDKDREVMLSELRSGLPYSAMTVSRAAEQLVQAGLVATHKDGVKVIIERNDNSKTLFDKARPFLIDPVIKTCYVERKAVSAQCIKAGLTALSEKTMLADDAFETFAIKSGVLDEDILHDERIDPARQVRMEIWKYDPQLLQRDGIVDPLSLVLTLDDSADERVEQAKEGLMNNCWEELTW